MKPLVLNISMKFQPEIENNIRTIGESLFFSDIKDKNSETGMARVAVLSQSMKPSFLYICKISSQILLIICEP